MTNKRKWIIAAIVVVVAVALIGGTYAYWNWQVASNQRTTITLTYADGFSCTADGGGAITSSDKQLVPASCTNSTYAIQRTITVTPTLSGVDEMSLNLWLNIVSMDTELRNSDNFNYALTKSSTSCTTSVIATGNFKGKANGSTVPLLENKDYILSQPDTYYLYIWLDKAETNNATMDKNFHFTLGGNCSNEIPEDTCSEPPSAPVLDNGMIPVTIADNGAVTAVSKNSSDWYSYCDKQWANAVLVSSTNRSTYQAVANGAATATAPVATSDILAYFVWIPRYEYKLWTLGLSWSGGVQEIPIRFVDNTTAKTSSTWYTHPAFTFGNTELDGIWVGKFETSPQSGTTCYSSPYHTTCNNANQTPLIVPGASALRYQTVSNQFLTALKFAGGSMSNNVVSFTGSSTYGLASTTDSHMMKNSEWGAVAYLSQSKYGKMSEVRKNNFWLDASVSGTETGCGASVSYADSSSAVNECAIPYDTVSDEEFTYPQSTTGNISGVFDMSGGANEQLMANWGNTVSDSGFSATWFNNNTKYYDLYDSNVFVGTVSTNMGNCTLATCGGHALNETLNWYGDVDNLLDASNPWLIKGGNFFSGPGAGIFHTNGNSGSTLYSTTFRAVIVTG